MRIKKAEEAHIKECKVWSAALAAATMSVRTNTKLIGLDKIREPLAFQAALRATGCPDMPEGFILPAHGVGVHTQEIIEVCAAAYDAALEAARDVVFVAT